MNAPAHIKPVSAASWYTSPRARAAFAALDFDTLTYRPHPLEPRVFPVGSGDWYDASNSKPCFACGECPACRAADALERLSDIRTDAIAQEAGVTIDEQTSADDLQAYLEVSNRTVSLSRVLWRLMADEPDRFVTPRSTEGMVR